MNNKGFTVVELLASFTLTMIIMIFLFEIVLQLKEIYINNALKTKIITQNAIIASTLNDKIENINILECEEISEEQTTCTITTNSGQTLYISINNEVIKIDDKNINYPDSTSIDNIAIKKIERGNNAYFNIYYTINSKYLDKNESFNYVYTYKTN